MADFRTEVFQNEFLSDGATDVHAIVTVTSSGAGTAASSGGGVAEIVIIDTSGSMSGPNIEAAKYAAQVAVDQIADGTWFAVIGGSHVANRAFPYPNAPVAIVQMEPGAREEAKRAISFMRPSGGTAMSTWLRLADAIFAMVPQAAQKHAILLTDGRNESEPRAELSKAISDVTGHFQCDARGVGSSWEVAELREIATALLGTVDLIRNPADIAEDFKALVNESMSKGVADAELRVWAPQGAQVLFVRRVAPTVEDITSRRTEVNALTGAYPTGAWGDESRDYHVAIRVPSKPVGCRAAGRARADRGRRGRAGVGAGQGPLVRRQLADRADQPRGRALHRPGRARVRDPGGAGRQGVRRRGHGDRQAGPRGPAGRRDRQRGGHVPAAAGGRDRRRGEGHRAPQAQRRQARRDGARHRVHQDHPGPPVSTVVCPNGHTSTSTDYCDVCGAPIESSAPAQAPEPAAAGTGTATTCPHCGAPAVVARPVLRGLRLRLHDGHRARAGRAAARSRTRERADARGPDPAPAALPTPAPDGAESWVAEVWVDPDWYAAQQPEDPMPSAGLPGLVPLRERSVLVGRPSASRNIHPAVDCGTDSGVSRRHCQLNTDGQRWWVEDLQSANGTYVSRAGDPLPTTPIPAGQRKEIEDGDRLYLGAWTRIVIRTALPGEV